MGGQSRDISHMVQLDSDFTGVGGVQPTHTIPRTADTMIAYIQTPNEVSIESLDSGKDVELSHAEDVMRDLLKTSSTGSSGSNLSQTQVILLVLAIVVVLCCVVGSI